MDIITNKLQVVVAKNNTKQRKIGKRIDLEQYEKELVWDNLTKMCTEQVGLISSLRTHPNGRKKLFSSEMALQHTRSQTTF